MGKNLFKIWLVALLSMMGVSSGWADNVSLSPSETTVIWASGNSENTDYGGMNFYDANATEWICTQANISGGMLNNQNASYGGSYAVITKFDASNQLSGMNILKATLKFNSVCTVSGKNSNVIISSIGTDWQASTATWNNIDRTATQLSDGTGVNVKNSTTELTQDVTDLVSNDEDKVLAFAIYTYTAREQKINNIKLEIEAVDAASSVEVKLLYVDLSNNELKSETTIGSAGQTLTLSAEQKASFFAADKKYIYVSDNSANVVISEGAEITLFYREAATWNYTLNAMAGEDFLATAAQGTVFENENAKAAYSRYFVKDKVLYEAPKTDDSKKQYNYTFAVSEDNTVKTISCTAKDITDVVFCTEAEDVEGLTISTAANVLIRASRSSSAYAAGEDVKIVKLSAGTYKFIVGVFDTSKNGDQGDFYLTDGENTLFNAKSSGVNLTEATSEEITLTEATTIHLKAGGSQNQSIDYIVITGNGSISTEPDVEPTPEPVAAHYGVIWQTGDSEPMVAGEFSNISLSAALFGEPIKAGDTIRVAYNFVDAARAAAPMRNVSAGALNLLSQNGENLSTIYENQDVNKELTAIEIEISEAMLQQLRNSEAVIVNYKGIEVTEVSLLEKKEAETPATITITNPSFELDGEKATSNGALQLTGWTFEGVGENFNNTELRPAESTSTTSAYGHSAPSEGDYSLFFRQGWNSNTNPSVITLSTQVTNIPEGAYALSVDFKAASSSNGEHPSGNTTVGISLSDESGVLGEATSVPGPNNAASDYFNTAEWQTVTAPVIVNNATANATITITLTAAGGIRSDFFIDNVQIVQIPAIEAALSQLEKAIAAAQAQADTYTVGEGLFYYAASEIEPLTQAIATAQAAYDTAESKEAVEAATATLNSFLSTFAPVLTTPVAGKAYAVANATADGNLCIDETVTVKKDATVYFTEVEGGYVLSNEAGLYLFKTTENNWTLSTTTDIASAYVLTVIPVEGGYTLKGAKGLLGLDNTAEGSTVYADKNQAKNGLWTIGEPALDASSYIVNADLTGTDGFDAAGTKGIDGSGIVKAGSGAQFDFKQTIVNLPAGKYRLTAQAAYRYGASEEDEYNAIQAQTDTKLATLYATTSTKFISTNVKNRYDGASQTDYANGEGSVTVNGMYVPNSSSAVQAWFNAGQYVNEIVFNNPEDGDVTIGIVKTAQPEAGDYTVIGPWTLTRIGDEEAEEVPAIEPGTDMTSYIVNPSFETGDLTGWTVGASSDTGVKPNSNATYTTEGIDGEYLFNTWWQGIPITQTVSGLPNGKYELKALMTNDAITAGNQPCLYLLANGEHSEAFSSANAGVFAEGSMQFYVTDGTATIGAIGGNADGSFNEAGYYWYKADNFRLTFVEALPNIDDIEIPEGKMSQAAANDLAAAQESGDAVTLLNAVKAAKESIEAYAHLKAVLDELDEVLENTNVYTTEAKETFDAAYNTAKNGYDEGTMSDADAKAFNYGSRLEGMLPSLLLSGWTSTVSGTPYINTWSIEGNNDGSEFRTPFFEYWTGDGESLGANTISAELTDLEAGEYEASVWVRVRIKNGAEAPAAGITLQVNEGEAVDVSDGVQVEGTQFYLKEVTAAGTVGEDGKLKIVFNVAEGNNISWLSFKNVKYVKKSAEPQPEEGVIYSWESPNGTPVETGGTISYENGDGDRLNYKNGDFYTICLNGKKGNMTEETPSANAGYMLVTLNEALSEGDKIEITAYINKNSSAKASAWLVFETEATADSGDFSDEANINEAFNGQQATKTIEVLSDAAGSKWFKMTRGSTGTNLFITKLQVLKDGSTNGIDSVTVQRGNDAIYNLSGQKVLTVKKGLYIINGKKVMVK